VKALAHLFIQVWDLETKEVIHTISAHNDSIWSIQVVGQLVYTCSDDNTVKVWDAGSPASSLTLLKTLMNPEDTRILSLAIGCGFIYSGTQNSKIVVWRLSDYEYVRTLEAHSWEVWQLAINPNGYLFSGSFDHTIKIWDTETLNCVKSLKCTSW
jgi:F-box/WD-40 domain protein 7